MRRRTDAHIMAVLKNNGYGLGLCEYAGVLSAMGVDRFAVANASEALALRRAGTDGEILVLAPVLDAGLLRELIGLNVSLQVSSLEQLFSVRRAVAGTGEKPKLHLKIDTGFGRWGFLPEELEAALPELRKQPFAGCYTHLAAAYGDGKMTAKQAERYFAALELLQSSGVETGTRHVCASGGTLKNPELHLDMVRLGSALVGGVPNAASWGLLPAARLEARVAHIKTVRKGESLGYGGREKLKSDRRVAVVAVGRYEGLRSNAHSGRLGRLMDKLRPVAPQLAELDGGSAPIVGGLGANHLMLDVSDIPCQVGDVASFDLNPIYCPASIRRNWRERETDKEEKMEMKAASD